VLTETLVDTTVADEVAAAVAAAGIHVVFGHPGGEVVHLIDAFERQGIRFILAHHETFAAFMACGYGEITGRPGVCLATLGPGATNMVTGTAGALLERAPMLAITGSMAISAPAGATHQRLDVNALYAPVTKKSIAVTDRDPAHVVAQAIALTTEGRLGPVHLSVPSDVAAGSSTRSAPASTVANDVATSTAAVSAAELDTARRLIAGSRRPAIVAGLRASRAEIGAALTALTHALSAVVSVLPKAKGVIAEDDPLFVGVIEMAGNDIVVDLLDNADLVIAVGLDAVEMDKPWRLGASVIVVDTVPNSDGYFTAAVDLVGDIADTLRALTPSAPLTSEWQAGTLDDHRLELRAHVCAPSDRLTAWQAVDAVRAAMPRSTVATTDVGIHKMLVGQAWTTYEPRTFFMSNGLSSMGYGIPVAAASWLVEPARPVVSFVGDGGLGMYLGELETLTRIGADVLIVVFADQSLELIKRAQLRSEIPTTGTHFGNPRFDVIADAFGIAGREVRTPDELGPAVAELTAQTGVRLLAVHIDGNDYRL
jgi:acetolactate synthase-1/2/3 large subunit